MVVWWSTGNDQSSNFKTIDNKGVSFPVVVQIIFSQGFANIGNKMNSKFRYLSEDLFWKGSKSIHNFCFTTISNRNIETYLSSQPKKSNNDIMRMDVVLL